MAHLLEANLSPTSSHWSALNKYSGTAQAMRGFATLPDVGVTPEEFAKLGLKGSGGGGAHLQPRSPARGRKLQSISLASAVNWTRAFLTTDGSRVQVRLWTDPGSGSRCVFGRILGPGPGASLTSDASLTSRCVFDVRRIPGPGPGASLMQLAAMFLKFSKIYHFHSSFSIKVFSQHMSQLLNTA